MRILILANSDSGLYQFRKELLEKLCEKNEIICSVPEKDGFIEKIEKIGGRCLKTVIDRRGKNPFKDKKLFDAYIKMIREVKPDVVLTYTVKPNIYGGLACQRTKIPYISNITGLGTAIENGGFISQFLLFLYRFGLRKAKCVFFQNDNNKSYFERKKIVSNNIRLIPGSGVNTETHYLEEYPQDGETFKFLFVGRVMKDKGIEELLKATERLHEYDSRVFLDIVGDCDEDYSEQLRLSESKGFAKYHGKQSDVHGFYANAHCVVLPSYHEGLANVLLEAASTGRPVIASKVPGCQETFDEGITGLGCEVRNADSLEEVMRKMLSMPFEIRKKMGLDGREKVKREFDRRLVVQAYMEEIEKVKKEKRVKVDL